MKKTELIDYLYDNIKANQDFIEQGIVKIYLGDVLEEVKNRKEIHSISKAFDSIIVNWHKYSQELRNQDKSLLEILYDILQD